MIKATSGIEDRRTIHSGWFDLLALRIRDGDRVFDRTLLEHPTGSAVLAYDPDRRVAMVVHQLRVGPLHVGAPAPWEAVAGIAEDGDYLETARREALEETGVALQKLEPVAAAWITPSSTTERVHFFLAPYSRGDRVAAGGGLDEEDENIVAQERPLAQLWAETESGALVDAKTLILLQALRIRRPELFA